MQRMLQNRGFEASGMAVDNRVSAPQQKAGGGFNLNLWKLDEEVQAYIPQELRDFADASLEDQREIDYLEPGTGEPTGSFDIVRSKLSEKDQEKGSSENSRLNIEIGEGYTLSRHIQGAIETMISDDYWAKTVKLDTTQPITHEVAKHLHQKGFEPIDLSPSIKGQELTMLDLGAEAGIYGVTGETLELIESAGLDYGIKGYGDQTTRIKVQP